MCIINLVLDCTIIYILINRIVLYDPKADGSTVIRNWQL